MFFAMKTTNLNILNRQIEDKILEALSELGFKEFLEIEKQECHFITLKKTNNKKLSNHFLQFFERSPLLKKQALESVQILTFILRPDTSGRGISSEEKSFSLKFYDAPLYSLN